MSTLLAIVVWMFVPKYYVAYTKLSDEYKETDIAIGLNKYEAKLHDMKSNDYINDMAVYCKMLKTEDFARALLHTPLPHTNETYGSHVIHNKNWWQSSKDTVKIILDNINYNFSNKQSTLKVSLSDKDAYIASYMLNEAVMMLQGRITDVRQNMANKALANAVANRRAAGIAYHEAQQRYASYIDSHYKTLPLSETLTGKKLEQDAKLAYDHYKECIEKCTRQEVLTKRATFAFATVSANVVPQDYGQYFVCYWASCLLLLLLAVKAYRLYKKHHGRIDFGNYLSPWAITISIWAFILFSLLAFRDDTILHAPNEQFYTSLVIWLIIFCTTSFATYNLLPSTPTTSMSGQSIKMNGSNMFFFNLLLLLSIIMTPLYLKKIYEVVLMFGTEDIMKNVRDYAVHGDAQAGLLDYVNNINVALLIVSLCAYPNVKKWQVAWTCLGCILNSLAIMEKGGILLVFFALMYIMLERQYVKMHTVVLLSLLMLGIFFGFNLMRSGADFGESNDDSIFDFIAMYVLSPPVAYSEISPEAKPMFGSHSLIVLLYYLNKFGLGNYEFFYGVQEFVFLPIPTNVYTIFQPFFLDFGQQGIAFFALIYGILTGWIYRYKMNGTDMAKCAYLYFSYILLLQFYQENLFTVSLFVPRVMLLAWLCCQKTFTLSFKHKSFR